MHGHGVESCAFVQSKDEMHKIMYLIDDKYSLSSFK